jgi:hypothetical protein
MIAGYFEVTHFRPSQPKSDKFLKDLSMNINPISTINLCDPQRPQLLFYDPKDGEIKNLDSNEKILPQNAINIQSNTQLLIDISSRCE